MNILIINGSARKNGLCQFIADNLSKKLVFLSKQTNNTELNITIFSLAQKNIKFCQGCVFCCANEKVYCSIKDDIQEAYKLMERADSIIYISPIYESFISGILKNFFDRTNHYTSFFKLAGKPINLILCGVQPLDGETKEFSNRHVVVNVNDYFNYYSIITHTKYRFLGFFQNKSHHSKRINCSNEEFEKEICCISKRILKQKRDIKMVESSKNSYKV